MRENKNDGGKAAREDEGKDEEAKVLCTGPSRQPVMVFGEPGLEKDNIAALIHFGSPRRRFPMFQVRPGRTPRTFLVSLRRNDDRMSECAVFK